MGKIFKLLKATDLLVTPYDFNVSNSEKSMTVFGGCLSLLVILLMIVYTTNYYFKLSTAQASVYTGTDSQELQIHQLDQSQMGFALELTKTKGSIISYMEGLSQYFTVEATVVEQTREQGVYGYKRINTPLISQRCSKEYIEQFNFKTLSFTQQQLDNFICFNGTYHLNGQFYDPNFTYIKIDIIKCQGNNCKSEQEIYDFLDGGIDVDLFIKDANIKSKYDPTNPAEIFPTNVFWRLSTSVGNNEDIFLSPVTIDQVLNKDIPFDGSTTDTRLYQSSKVTKQERRQMSFDLQTVTSMCTFYFRMSNSSNNYFINDTSTLALILSSISEGTGLTLAIISVLKILYKFYCEHKTFETIMNHVFKFELNNEIDEQKQVKTQENKQDKIDKINKLFRKKITYSFFSLIAFYIKTLFPCFFKQCCSSIDKEFVIAQMAKTKIQSDLNLAQIVQKLYEIDCIKLFLFDDDQIKLFNTFCYPFFTQQMIKQRKDIKKWNKQISKNFEESNKKQNEIMSLSRFLQPDIPLYEKLVKLSPFFKAQAKLNEGKIIEDTVQKIKVSQNKNNNKNQRFINFLTQKTLYKRFETNTEQNITHPESNLLHPKRSNFSQQSPNRNNVNQVNFDSEYVPSQEEHQIIIGYINSNNKINQYLNE